MARGSAKLKARNPRGSEMHATGRGLHVSCGVAILLALAPLCNAQTVEKTSPAPQGKLQVATCQFPVCGDIQANADFIRRQMREARQQGAELVHFPECALSGYAGQDFPSAADLDWELLHKETDSILALAKELGVWVVLGSTHRLSGDHKPHNSLYVINAQGQIVDRYDKRFCTESDLHHYSPGDHFVTFDINGVKCGLLICYDIRFPELYRQYAKLGVQLMFHSFYNARQKPGGIHPKIMPPTAQAYAGVNYMFISLNNSSAEHSWQSRFITPDGLVAAELPLGPAGRDGQPGRHRQEVLRRQRTLPPRLHQRQAQQRRNGG